MIHSPLPPVKIQIDPHVRKQDEAISICLVLGTVLGSVVGAGMHVCVGGGYPMLGCGHF